MRFFLFRLLLRTSVRFFNAASKIYEHQYCTVSIPVDYGLVELTVQNCTSMNTGIGVKGNFVPPGAECAVCAGQKIKKITETQYGTCTALVCTCTVELRNPPPGQGLMKHEKTFWQFFKCKTKHRIAKRTYSPSARKPPRHVLPCAPACFIQRGRRVRVTHARPFSIFPAGLAFSRAARAV